MVLPPFFQLRKAAESLSSSKQVIPVVESQQIALDTADTFVHPLMEEFAATVQLPEPEVFESQEPEVPLVPFTNL